MDECEQRKKTKTTEKKLAANNGKSEKSQINRQHKLILDTNGVASGKIRRHPIKVLSVPKQNIRAVTAAKTWNEKK